MGYTVLIVISLLVAALIVFLAVRLLINLRWVVGFIRGSTGLALLGIAGGIGLCAVDLSTYHEVVPGKQLVTISFVKRDEQAYTVTVVDSAGTDLRADINGDMWQSSVRVIEWSGLIKLAGVSPGFRMDRITGRYYALEQERKAKRDEALLVASRFGIDLWKGIYDNSFFVPGVDAKFSNTAFLPMADGALFEISLTDSGLVARPLNEPAQRSVAEWQ